MFFKRLIKLLSRKKDSNIKLNSEFTDGLLRSVYYLVDKQSLTDRRDVALSYSNFIEILQRLLGRLSNLLEIELQINQFNKKGLKNLSGEEKNRIQSDFVNKTESLHQQTYATISALILLLTKIAPSNFKNHLPRWSVKKFIEYSIEYEPKLTKYGKVLLDSEIIRNKCIDHPQHSQPFDWQTFSMGKTYVIYYNSDSTQGQIDLTNKVKSPIKIFSTFRAKEAFVTPHHMEVFNAICGYSHILLKSIANDDANK
jgi:hypothetical protein